MKINNIYLARIKIIRDKKILSWKDVACELGIAYATILRIVDKRNKRGLSIKTKRKMAEYIKNNEEYLQ